MPEFKYKAKDAAGKTVTGHKFASSRDNIVIELERKALVVISVREVIKEESSFKKISAAVGKAGRKVKTFDLIILCRQLATMMHGGVPIINAIESISEEMRNKGFKEILENVAHNLRSGMSLSESLKKRPDVFSKLFIAIVEAGEKVGALDDMLHRLSGYLESRERLGRKMRSATTYPIFIAGFFLFAVAVITLFLIPRFKEIYEGFGAELPGLTMFIFKVSGFFIDNIVFVAIALTIAVFSVFIFVRHTRRGRALLDKGLLNLPVFGDAIKKAAISKFCRTLSTLLAQGISITEALLLVGRVSGNVVIEDSSSKASKLIAEGETILSAVKKMGIFPGLMLQMVSVGVESGSLPELLDKTADFYEEQVDTFIDTTISLIEPILVVSLGAVIAVLVIALYLPIFKLGSAIAGGG